MKLFLALLIAALAFPLWAVLERPSMYDCLGPRCFGPARLILATGFLLIPAGLRAAWLLRIPNRGGPTRAFGWLLALFALLVVALAAGSFILLLLIR